MNKLISVILTCHNLERYIGIAIDSVLAQDYPGPVEIVVVDDCSTDQSAEIISSYKNIRHLKPSSNLGVLMATVLGLENTTGELVFFLDGDDVWEPFKLSTAVDRFQSAPNVALVTHDLSYIDGSGVLIDRKSRPEEVMASIPPPEEDILTRNGVLLHGDYVWLGSAYAVHRTLGNLQDFCVFAKGLPDPFNTYQDWPLAFWVACQPKVSFGYLNRKLFRYRLHGANHSGDATSVSKARRNVRRTHNTMEAIRKIADRFQTDARVHQVTAQKLSFYAYLDALYSGHKWQATKGFWFSVPYLMNGPSSFLKETTRFVGVQLLGIERFLRFSSATKSIART